MTAIESALAWEYLDVVSAVADAGGVPAAQFLAQAAFVSGNGVAAKDFDMNRQGFALGRYSAVGVSGDNINFDACLVDLRPAAP